MPPPTPPLVLKASEIPEYAALIEDAINWAKSQSQDKAQQIIDAGDKLAVNIGLEVLKIVPGRISTEVDARLSFDTAASIAKARKLIRLYNEAGISNDRILIGWPPPGRASVPPRCWRKRASSAT